MNVRAPPLRERLIPLLADGAFHSGEQLAHRLGVSRTAVWKTLNGMSDLGVELQRVPKRGYRLVLEAAPGAIRPLELLETSALERELSVATRARLRQLTVLWQVDSTNSFLLERQDLPVGLSDVCLAEQQSAGRGRRGRSWAAPFGCSLCLSVSGTFPQIPPQLSALSLAAGVAVLRALARFEVRALRLKWPNDLVSERGKVGGILTELRAEAGGPVYAVVGVGLNVFLTSAARHNIGASLAGAGLEPAALSEVARGRALGRNALAGALIDSLLGMFGEFELSGFHAFAAEWRGADALANAAVQVSLGEQVHKGIARGVDAQGALLLETPQRLLRFTAGEVSVRAG